MRRPHRGAGSERTPDMFTTIALATAPLHPAWGWGPGFWIVPAIFWLLIIGLIMIVPLFIVVIFAHRKETRTGGIKYEDLRGELGKEITHKL